ncbi:unnamed protein product [Caenorhabditis bovis]|uniref:non-specific serine/threonine protein kinase n=1 Tax=Caenorhabditis bovis TaxID=2654633 RepID=A0A8S1DZK8_9PELO|nr:unnamed protein product [Caenorhabditis bovis]
MSIRHEMLLTILLVVGVAAQQQTSNAQYVSSNQYTAGYSSGGAQYDPSGQQQQQTLNYNSGATSTPIMYDAQSQQQYGGSQYNAQNQQYGTQYDAQGNQQYNSGSQVQGYSTNGISTSNSQYSQNAASSGSSSVSLMDYSFNNGNCQYKDGQVIENGQTRQATQQELAQIQQYRQAVDNYMSQVNGYVGNWINSVFQSLPSTNGSFPNIPTMPTMPQAPCLCSQQNCGTVSNLSSAAGTSPQMDYSGNQQYSQNRQYNQQQQYATMGDLIQLEVGKMVKKWRIDKKLGEGAFGAVYKCSNEKGDLYALKVEGKDEKIQLLKMEVFVLSELNKNGGRHFCRIEDKGQYENFNYVVMTFVGMSLADLRMSSPNKRFSMGTAISVGRQCLEALEELHNIGYLHRDVKPGNYTIGRAELDELRKVYVLDFGMARKFVHEDGTIKKPRNVAGFRGTVKYAPVSCHAMRELCRQDDCETWLYMLVELTKGSLPWRNMTDIAQIGNEKRAIRMNEVAQKKFYGGCPREYIDIMRTIDSGRFFDEPNYQRIYYLLRSAMENTGAKEYPYDWEEWLMKKYKEEKEKKKAGGGGGGEKKEEKKEKKKDEEIPDGKSLKEKKEKDEDKEKKDEKKDDKE